MLNVTGILGRKMQLLIAIFSLLFSVAILTPINISAQQESVPIEIIYSDNYNKTVKQGESTTYNWTLKNTQVDQSFRIDIFFSEPQTGWTATVNKDFFVLEPNESWTSTLTVTSMQTNKRGSLTTIVTFRITNNTDRWNVVAPTVTTSIYEEIGVLGLFSNPLPPPLNNRYGVFLLDVVLWCVIILIVYFGVEIGIRHITKGTKTKLDDIIFTIIRTPILIILILYAAVASAATLDLPEFYLELLNKIYYIVFIIVIIYVTYKVFKEIVIYYGKLYAARTETSIDDVVIPLAEKIGIVIIIIAGVALLLSYIGIDLTMLAVGTIVISMVVAFALQDTLSNFFSGLYLLTDRPFKVGDLITLESGETCRVERIGMRSTRLYKLFEHTVLIVPNNKIASERIVNVVEPDLEYKIKVDVGVAYGSDIQKVKRILSEVAMAHPNVAKDKDKGPVVRFIGFGESSLNFIVVVWVDNVYNQWKVASDLREEINKRFEEERIEIPFPQRVVWHRGHMSEK